MKRTVLPLALVFAASAAFACPGADKSADAKAHTATTATAATRIVPAASQQGRAEADKKVVKQVEAKKQTT